jgi:hypothetical protein
MIPVIVKNIITFILARSRKPKNIGLIVEAIVPNAETIPFPRALARPG